MQHKGRGRLYRVNNQVKAVRHIGHKPVTGHTTARQLMLKRGDHVVTDSTLLLRRQKVRNQYRRDQRGRRNTTTRHFGHLKAKRGRQCCHKRQRRLQRNSTHIRRQRRRPLLQQTSSRSSTVHRQYRSRHRRHTQHMHTTEETSRPTKEQL